jgi:hypothetical protein
MVRAAQRRRVARFDGIAEVLKKPLMTHSRSRPRNTTAFFVVLYMSINSSRVNTVRRAALASAVGTTIEAYNFQI